MFSQDLVHLDNMDTGGLTYVTSMVRNVGLDGSLVGINENLMDAGNYHTTE